MPMKFSNIDETQSSKSKEILFQFFHLAEEIKTGFVGNLH